MYWPMFPKVYGWLKERKKYFPKTLFLGSLGRNCFLSFAYSDFLFDQTCESVTFVPMGCNFFIRNPVGFSYFQVSINFRSNLATYCKYAYTYRTTQIWYVIQQSSIALQYFQHWPQNWVFSNMVERYAKDAQCLILS